MRTSLVLIIPYRARGTQGGIYIKTVKKVKFPKYPIPKYCLYCGGDVILTENKLIYGRNYYKGDNCMCYVCWVCRASVGTHPDGKTPLGRLANRELKELKKTAHKWFDPIWQARGGMERQQAYKELALRLGISVRECHFGWFDKAMLLKAINEIIEWRGY